MDTVLIRLEVPAAGISLDAFLPNCLTTDDATALLAEAAENYSRGFYRTSGEETICVERLGCVMMPGTSVAQYKLMNGDCLMLI